MVRTRFKKAKAKPGPKSGCTPDVVEKMYRMALFGLTDKEIAQVLQIPEITLSYWKAKKPEVEARIAQGRIEADLKVAHSLFQKAIGFTRDEEQLVVTQGRVVIHQVKKYYPADIKAIQMWLCNRSKGRWVVTHHHKVEHSGDITHRHQSVDMSDFSMEELKVLRKYALAN